MLHLARWHEGLVDPNLSKHSHVHHFSHVIEKKKKKEKERRTSDSEIRLCLENRKAAWSPVKEAQ